MSGQTLVHATCIAVGTDDGWRGVLLTGPSGSGKSDLALRLIDGGGRLVADDQTLLVREGPILLASAPATIAGMVEARGVDLLCLPLTRRLDRVHIVAQVELVAAPDVERLPDPTEVELLGVKVPRWQACAFEPSAPAKIRLALQSLPPGPTAARGDGTAVRPVVLVTGLSGAGRATTLKALEDLGYVAVDNVPLPFLESLLRDSVAGDRYPVAFGVDVRTWGFDARAVLDRLALLRARADLRVALIYLDCDTDVLLRRYTETRRPHPLAQDRPVQDAIADERHLLEPLREDADVSIDTSALSPHDLKRLLSGQFALGSGSRLRIALTSFSFRRGLPREADMVFDARFLRNPHYVAELKPLTGLDPPVRDYVAADPAWQPFVQSLEQLVAQLLPRFDAEGKTYLTIAIGCTGGRHRSVAVSAWLADRLRALGREVSLVHRDAALAPVTSATAPSPASTNDSKTTTPGGVR
jgi:UPF0042 nucleotide-binding protein